MGVMCPKCQRETGVEGRIYNQIDYINPEAFLGQMACHFFLLLAQM